MSLHELAMAAAELTKPPPEGQGLWVFPVPGCAPRDAVDRPQRAYELFMAHPSAQSIGAPAGVTSMIVAISVETAGLRWFKHNFGRFPATRVHGMPGGGYDLLYKMPLPPVPILHCSHGKLAPGVNVLAEGGGLLWPAPAPYQDITPGCEVTHAAPMARLPRWITERLTREPRPKVPPGYRPPRRGIDVIREGLAAYVKYSQRGPRADVTFAAACRAGQLVAQGALGETEVLELVAGTAVDAGLASDEAWAAARCGMDAGIAQFVP
jgi:hypothetical protein